jgi:hypothetical protein
MAGRGLQNFGSVMTVGVIGGVSFDQHWASPETKGTVRVSTVSIVS